MSRITNELAPKVRNGHLEFGLSHTSIVRYPQPLGLSNPQPGFASPEPRLVWGCARCVTAEGDKADTDIRVETSYRSRL